jgi:hypothetical protein
MILATSTTILFAQIDVVNIGYRMTDPAGVAELP